MSDQYAWWRNALETGDGRELTRDQMLGMDTSESDPQSGFYRTRQHKDGPFVPVAIWRDGDQVICLQNGKQVPDERIETVWTYACRWPISEELYHAVIKGGAWPGEPPTVPKDHNQRPTGDVHEDLTREYLAEKELADGFLKEPVKTQEQADQAAVWAKRISAIASKATAQHKVEKQPSLDEGRRIDDRWRDLREGAAALAKQLKRHMDEFLIERDRLERERQRKAQEVADRKRREAEEAARAAAAQADDETARAKAEQAEKDLAEAERSARAQNVSGGRTGAKVSLHTYYVAKIVDYDKLLMSLKDESEIREAVERIANRIARTKGAPMPEGSERAEDRRAA